MAFWWKKPRIWTKIGLVGVPSLLWNHWQRIGGIFSVRLVLLCFWPIFVSSYWSTRFESKNILPMPPPPDNISCYECSRCKPSPMVLYCPKCHLNMSLRTLWVFYLPLYIKGENLLGFPNESQSWLWFCYRPNIWRCSKHLWIPKEHWQWWVFQAFQGKSSAIKTCTFWGILWAWIWSSTTNLSLSGQWLKITCLFFSSLIWNKLETQYESTSHRTACSNQTFLGYCSRSKAYGNQTLRFFQLKLVVHLWWRGRVLSCWIC